MHKLEPAKSVIEKLGGPEAVSRLTGRHISRVYRWMYPKDRGGTGGVIPHDEARKLLSLAPGAVRPEDFFGGGETA